jgi:hypothetical protein
MRWIVAVVLVAACGPAGVQERSESSIVAACDWCPGSPSVTTIDHPLGGTIEDCLCSNEGGRSTGMRFWVVAPPGEEHVTCAHVQCMFAFYCSPPPTTPAEFEPHCPP